ncbi:MAG TPA: hypothetical protein VK467_09965 [Gemmatimonadales bacterium]|nr:hypothetical protein [Gemmatimonadales bacterium]
MGDAIRTFLTLAAVVGGPLLAVMVVPVLAKRFLRMSHGSADAPRADIEDLRARMAELDDMSRRVAELEERVDFAERLLAQQRDTAFPRAKS